MVGILDNACHHNRDSLFGFNTIKIGIEMRPYPNNTMNSITSLSLLYLRAYLSALRKSYSMATSPRGTPFLMWDLEREF